MTEYQKFLEALMEKSEWYGFFPTTLSFDREPIIQDLNARQIRKKRSEARSVQEVVEANHPHLIGVVTPPWMWRRLTHQLDYMQPFDPYKYNYLDYDPGTPMMVYAGDRMLLKELFAGGVDAKHELGAKVDGSKVDGPTFDHRATKYLVSILSQIAQVARRQDAKAEGDGDTTPIGTPETVQPDDKASTTDTLPSS